VTITIEFCFQLILRPCAPRLHVCIVDSVQAAPAVPCRNSKDFVSSAPSCRTCARVPGRPRPEKTSRPSRQHPSSVSPGKSFDGDSTAVGDYFCLWSQPKRNCTQLNDQDGGNATAWVATKTKYTNCCCWSPSQRLARIDAAGMLSRRSRCFSRSRVDQDSGQVRQVGALCLTKSLLFRHGTAGAGLDTVDDADVQSRSAGTQINGIRQTRW